MAVRSAEARWEGTLKEGKGNLKVASGAYDGGYSFSSRFEEGSPQTNPEELLGAAHAGCYSMALNAALERAGTPATYIQSTAKVHLTRGDEGLAITQIDIVTEGEVPGIDDAAFQEAANNTLQTCIISRALSAVPMTVSATLK